MTKWRRTGVNVTLALVRQHFDVICPLVSDEQLSKILIQNCIVHAGCMVTSFISWRCLIVETMAPGKGAEQPGDYK